MADRSDILAPPPVVAMLGWLIPGAGYWLLGQRLRAIVIGVTILLIFAGGVLVGGIRIVQAPDMSGQGTLGARLLQRPWFMGQVLAGPVGIGAAYASDSLAQNPRYKKVQ